MPTLPRFTEHDDDELIAYRSVSSAAVVGLLLALVSAVAFLSPWLWFLPIIALAVSGVALVRIARAEALLTGRKAAWAGVILSTFVLAAAAAEWVTYRRLLEAEARQFADLWFEEMAAGAPQRAFALTVPPRHRPPLWPNEVVWDFYRTAPTYRRDLGVYLKDKLIRTMLALGDKAEVRYRGHAGIGMNEANDVVFPLYTVTFDDDGEKKTFFVVLTVERIALPDGRGEWQLKRAEGGVRPE